MAYELHITREDKIDLAEWKQLVSKTDGVRCSQKGRSARGPDGSSIELKPHPGDVDVFFPDESSWDMVFRLSSSDDITFKAPVDWDDNESIVRKLAIAMAKQLNAQIEGDEGEVYYG